MILMKNVSSILRLMFLSKYFNACIGWRCIGFLGCFLLMWIGFRTLVETAGALGMLQACNQPKFRT